MRTAKPLNNLRLSLDAVRSWRGRPHREAGDRARDEHRWADAAAHYEAYLRQSPRDVGIWVQLGNTCKEAGRLEAATEAYDQAIALDPRNADAHLQKGHLLKVSGSPDDALQAFRQSVSLNNVDNPAFAELLNLGSDKAVELLRGGRLNKQAAKNVIFLDVTDLIDYLKVNVSLSGIQRVVSNLVLYGLSDFSNEDWAVIPVLPDYSGSEMMSVSIDILQGLIGVVAKRSVNRLAIDRALEAIWQSRAVVQPKAGDAFLIAGAFWIFHRYDILNALRRAGVHVSLFVHDLIQVTNPEYVESAATLVFRRSLCDVLATASSILTNSRFVADEMLRHLATRTNITLPVTPVTLATELGTAGQDGARASREVIETARADYVLCVGTIEIRKNHLYLVRLWERLIAEFDGEVPNLVFAGKWGWQVEELLAYLSGSDYLGGRLHILNAISDGDLAYLYAHCLFTIYPSFAEGWGLPVGESLGFGRPCIASSATAIPEVGGPLCRYVDPLDVADGYRVVSSTLADREDLARWTQEVRATFKPKTWRDFSVELFETVRHDALATSARPRSNNCILDAGEIAPLGDDALIEIDSRRGRLVTARMARESGWYDPEAIGCWMSNRRASLTFGTPLPEDTPIVVFLHLCTASGDKTAACTVGIGAEKTAVEPLSPTPAWHAVRGAVAAGGAVNLSILAGRGFFNQDGREQYACLIELLYYSADDEAMRQQAISRVLRGL